MAGPVQPKYVQNQDQIRQHLDRINQENQKEAFPMLEVAAGSALIAGALIAFKTQGVVRIGIGEIDGKSRFYSPAANKTFSISNEDSVRISNAAKIVFSKDVKFDEVRGMTALGSNDLVQVVISLS